MTGRLPKRHKPSRWPPIACSQRGCGYWIVDTTLEARSPGQKQSRGEGQFLQISCAKVSYVKSHTGLLLSNSIMAQRTRIMGLSGKNFDNTISDCDRRTAGQTDEISYRVSKNLYFGVGYMYIYEFISVIIVTFVTIIFARRTTRMH